VLSVDRERKKDGRKLDRFYVIICTIAMQLQFQLIIHFLPDSSGFHFYTHAFRSLLRVFYALPTVKCRLLRHVRDATLTRAAITNITLLRMTCAGSHLLTGIRHSTPAEQIKKFEKVKYCGSIHTLRSLPDKGGNVCAKFGSDWFINVYLYKVQTNKRTNKQILSFKYKIFCLACLI
jgi:hypothetical protein